MEEDVRLHGYDDGTYYFRVGVIGLSKTVDVDCILALAAGFRCYLESCNALATLLGNSYQCKRGLPYVDVCY